MRGEAVLPAAARIVHRGLRDRHRVGPLEGVRRVPARGVELLDEDAASPHRVAEADLRGDVRVGRTVDDAEHELALSLRPGGDRVEHREGPKVGETVRPRARLRRRNEVMHVALDRDVQGGLAQVVGEKPERMVDRLQEQALRAGDDGGDHVHELGEVGHLDGVGVADERVEVGRHGQRVAEVVLLLEPGRPVHIAEPHVPFVVRDMDRMPHLVLVPGLLDQRPGDAQGALRLVRRQHVGPVIVVPCIDVNAVPLDVRREAVDHRGVPVAQAGFAAGDSSMPGSVSFSTFASCRASLT